MAGPAGRRHVGLAASAAAARRDYCPARPSVEPARHGQLPLRPLRLALAYWLVWLTACPKPVAAILENRPLSYRTSTAIGYLGKHREPFTSRPDKLLGLAFFRELAA
ncbi:hypothetical protein RRG08_033727 [Elysia crispata]|uniref:Uncharacterized protein n=1 Tax=Elysia crispata TaxID=231223 RepID=A0AAE1A8X4_9GAST|nr:hypothetical protein RRG08_033727 [Elysia crispata]